jgi:pimeloyl-ACP methyl ester carboxylesterase
MDDRHAIAALLAVAMTGSACRQSAPPPPTKAELEALATGEAKWVMANGLRLKTLVYRTTPLGERPTLVVALHGDSPIGRPSIQFVFAQRAAAQLTNAVVVGLLRPGYTDGAGDASSGTRGRATGDNYTPQVVDAVRDVVAALRKEFAPRAVVMVGHSGGAAITADLIGRSPGAADAALLVSCPCNVPAWQTHMMKAYVWPYGPMALVFKLPNDSLSPIDLADRVPTTLPVRLLVGERDTVAPPRFTDEYAGRLKQRGVDAMVTVVPGLGHEMFLESIAFEQLARLVASPTRAPSP